MRSGNGIKTDDDMPVSEQAGARVRPSQPDEPVRRIRRGAVASSVARKFQFQRVLFPRKLSLGDKLLGPPRVLAQPPRWGYITGAKWRRLVVQPDPHSPCDETRVGRAGEEDVEAGLRSYDFLRDLLRAE